MMIRRPKTSTRTAPSDTDAGCDGATSAGGHMISGFGHVASKASVVSRPRRSFKLFVAAAIAGLAVVASGALASPASANNFNPPCQYTDGFYKYSGVDHVDGSLPTWPYVKMNQTIQWWGFTNQNTHIGLWLGIANYYPGGVVWIQAGVWGGYDAWGNPLTTNYPLGSYSNSYHPNYGNGPQYTPNGQFAEFRYAEYNLNGDEHVTYIGQIGTGNGLTLEVRNDGGGYFSLVDQDNHVIGGSLFDHAFMGGSGTFYTEAFQESATFNEGNSYCAWVSASSDHLTGVDTASSFWNSHIGCDGNSENTADPNCHGGAGTSSAPLDFLRYLSGSTLNSISYYCQEGISGGGGFAAINGLGPSVINVQGAQKKLNLPKDKQNLVDPPPAVN